MKKYLWLLLLLLILPLPALATSDISTAKFYGIITTTNNSTAATVVSSNITGADSADLVASGFLNATATNVVVRNTAGADAAFMPGYGTNPWCFFAGSLGASSSSSFLAYFKDVTGGKISYFPGSTGMAVTDSASLEPSSNFTMQTTGVYLTSSGTVVRKNVAYYEYYDGSSYYVDDYSTHIVSTAETEDGADTLNHVITMPASITAGNLLLIVFSASGSGGIATPAGWTLGANSPNGLAYIFYKVAAGGDTVTIVTTNSMRAAAVTYNIIGAGTPEFGTASNGNSANPDPPSKTVTTTPFAHIWIAAEGNDGARTVSAYPTGYGGGINANTASSCAGTAHVETYALAANPATFTINGVANWDSNTIMVPITDIAATSELSAVVAQGEHDILITNSAGGSSLTIDSVEVDTGAALVITDTTTNWQFGSAATPYIGQMKVTVGGVTKGQWDWEYPVTTASTLTNGTGTATGSPITLAEGNNVITVTGAGTFWVGHPYGWRAIATSGTATVTASPVTMASSGSRDVILFDGITVVGTGSINIELQHVFVDQSSNQNDGTPSFRTTSSDADVTSTLTFFGPVSEPEAPAFAVGAGPDFLSDNITASGNFTTGNSTLNYPGKAIIDAVASAGGVPYQIPSTFISAFFLIALSLMTSYFLKSQGAGSLFAKSVVNYTGYGILVALHIFDWWMLIIYFLFEPAVWSGAKERRE